MKKILLILCFLLLEPSFAFCDSAINRAAFRPDWFKNFNDENLVSLIYEGLENNKDVQIARKNLLISKQELNKSFSRFFPNVNTAPGYTLIKLPKTAIPSTDIQTNSFALPFLSAWEIDYLGANVNRINKRKLELQNTYWDLISSRLTIAIEIAAAYFNASNITKQAEIQMLLIKALEANFSSRKKMYNQGLISAMELNDFEEDLINEKNNLYSLLKQKEIFLTEIAFLTGKSPLLICEIKINPFDEIDYIGIYPTSLSGEIISNRPDIIKLENEIKKAKIDITLAKKEFFPKINVIGAMVFSTIVQNFGWDGVFAGLAATASLNLFDGGKRIFNLKEQKAKYELALETYLKADLNALKEINDSLYILKTDMKIYENNLRQYELQNKNFINVFSAYNQGTKSLIDYKDTNIELMRRQMALLNSKNRKLIDLLTLYKATGGAL